MKRTITFIVSLAIIGLITTAYAAGPAPYSESATHKICKSISQMGVFVPPVGGTKTESFKSLYDYYSKAFAKAGYSFEKAIIQLSNDLNKDDNFYEAYPYNITPAGLVYGLSLSINEGRMHSGVNKASFDKSFSKQTQRALDNIYAIYQRKETAKKADELKRIQMRQAEQEKFNKEGEERHLSDVKENDEMDK